MNCIENLVSLTSQSWSGTLEDATGPEDRAREDPVTYESPTDRRSLQYGRTGEYDLHVLVARPSSLSGISLQLRTYSVGGVDGGVRRMGR